MKITRRNALGLGTAGLFFLASCFNIYVQFPTSELSEGATRYVQSVFRDAGQTPATAPAEDDHERAGEREKSGRSGFSFLPVLHAAEGGGVDVKIDSPAIRKIKEEQAARIKKLTPHFEAGRVGFAANGDVAIRNEDGLDLKTKKDVRETVEAENKSRAELYREVARANKIELERVDEIRAIWAKAWIDEAPVGWWVEIDGKWQKKPPKAAEPK